MDALAKLQARFPKFRGCEPLDDGTGRWRTQIRNPNAHRLGGPTWREIGIFPTRQQAWRAYKKSRPRKIDRSETTAKIDRLMRASEAVPVTFSVEQSLWRSTMS